MALAPESGYCDPGSKLCVGIVRASKFMMVTVCVYVSCIMVSLSLEKLGILYWEIILYSHSL